MLQNTFRHIEKIGPTTEFKLWEAGALTWEEGLEIPFELLPVRKPIDQALHASIEKLEEGDPAWFSARLPGSECWRLFPEFREKVAYIDIETDGGSSENGMITTISLWDGSNLYHYVHGDNLRDFQDDILDYSLLVTWNGASFDIPFIESWYRTTLPHAHIDLRHVLNSLGYRGGLKSVEQQFEISRGMLDGVDGYTAVLLWKDYVNNGDSRALETLLAYNSLDVVNLERLMVEAYNLKIEETPFALVNEIPLPVVPDDLGVQPHPESLQKVRETLMARENYLRDLARHLISGRESG